ncbi:alpha/beta fold hydrolase [Amycolatopsis sp. NPDC051102]|uniref:alpha/beta fold hydrolase n=1 Tax=Amycolatopsis sp. NPDC051102 TaxID=3155163 RepID=UPI003417ECC8
MVLLHGFGQTWRAWTPILPALEAQCEVLAPTLAGHWGTEPAGGGRPAPETMADEIERWMDRERLDKAHLVGHSIGAWVALELIRRGRALSTVALCPSAVWPSTVCERLRLITGLALVMAMALVLAPCGHSLLRPYAVRRALMWWLVYDIDRVPAGAATDDRAQRLQAPDGAGAAPGRGRPGARRGAGYSRATPTAAR